MIVTIILFGGLVLFLLLGFPIAIAIFLATLAGFLYCDVSLAQMVQRMFASVNSFTILAIPFFMLAGSLMETGGMSQTPGALCPLTGVLAVRWTGACAGAVLCVFCGAVRSAPGYHCGYGRYPDPRDEAKGIPG